MTAPGLSSWNDTPSRAAIEAYVERVTTDGAGFVPPEQRVAVFDNDGTLWCEKPISPPHGSLAANPVSSSTMYSTLGALSGASGWRCGSQSGTESLMSMLISPWNGGVAMRALPS